MTAQGQWRENSVKTETDTLHIDFRDASVSESRDIDENTLVDIDGEDNICAITVAHASTRAGSPRVSYEQITA